MEDYILRSLWLNRMPVNLGELSVSGKSDLNILAEALMENTTNGYGLCHISIIYFYK